MCGTVFPMESRGFNTKCWRPVYLRRSTSARNFRTIPTTSSQFSAEDHKLHHSSTTPACSCSAIKKHTTHQPEQCLRHAHDPEEGTYTPMHPHYEQNHRVKGSPGKTTRVNIPAKVGWHPNPTSSNSPHLVSAVILR